MVLDGQVIAALLVGAGLFSVGVLVGSTLGGHTQWDDADRAFFDSVVQHGLRHLPTGSELRAHVRAALREDRADAPAMIATTTPTKSPKRRNR